MNQFSNRVRIIGAVWSAFALQFSASGAVLPPATAQTRPGEAGTNYSTSEPAWFVAGNLVASHTSVFTPISGAIDGVLVSKVYQEPISMNLGFEYVFDRTLGSGASVLENATIGDSSNPWLGVTITDAGRGALGASTMVGAGWTDGTPYAIARDAAGSGAGLRILWANPNILGSPYGTAIKAGDKSSQIFFATDAKLFQLTSVGLLDSGASSGAFAFAPATAVPEPGTVMLFGLGLGILYRKRRRS